MIRIGVSFNKAQFDKVKEFAGQVNMPIAEFCKRAVFYSINDAYRRAEEAQNNGTDVLQSEPGIPETNSGETSVSGSTDTAALSNKTDTTAHSQE